MPTPAKNISSSIGLMVWSMPSLKPEAAQHDRGDRGEQQAAGDRIGDVVLREERDAAVDQRADEQHDDRGEQRASAG